MISLLKKYAALVLLTFVTGSIHAQSPYFQNYYLLNRKEPVHVNAIFQDKTGFIWIGTDNGLFQFDGTDLRRYTSADSLPDENVTAIGQDFAGRIWVGHKNGWLSTFEKGKIEKFVTDEGPAAAPVSDILFDRKGNLWFATLNDGLYYYIENRLFRLDDTDGMPDIFVYDLEEDAAGNIWAGTDGGVAVCTLSDRKTEIRVIDQSSKLPDNIIKKIVKREDGTMWLGSEDAGIFSYNLSDGKIGALKSNWSHGPVDDFVMEGNQVWIASVQSGISVFDRQTKTSRKYSASPEAASATSLLRDLEGNIWTGSRTGLFRTLGNYVEFIESSELSGDANILSLAADQGGNLWFSNGKGLFKRRVDESGNVFVEKQFKGMSYENFTTISLFADAQGYVWAGFFGEGIVRINLENGKINYFQKDLRNGNVLNISGKHDVVWLATLGGATRIKISGDDYEIKNFSREEGLVSDYIYQTFTDSKNRVWFATDRDGVDMMDESGFHHYLEDMTSNAVYGFAEDGTGTIWANVQGEGLYRFTGNDFQKADSLSSRANLEINILTSNSAGRLVTMHDLGIDVLDLHSSKLRSLGEEVGIRDKKANLNAVAKDAFGKIYLGTDNGILIYSGLPDEIASAPSANLLSLKAFDQSKELSENLRLRYDENNLTFQFTGFWYQNPGGISFQYQLENYDHDWITTRSRFVIYSRLPNGNYTFRVKASSSENFSDATEASFQFTVRPPFWRTPPFYVAAAVLILLAGYAYLNYRERQLKIEKMLLERKVNERTFEIQKKNEEIQAQSEEIRSINENLEKMVLARTSELEKKNKALEEYAFINAHNLRSPVASILGLINLLCKSEIKEIDTEMTKHLQESAEKLDSVVKSITEAIERGDILYPNDGTPSDRGSAELN